MDGASSRKKSFFQPVMAGPGGEKPRAHLFFVVQTDVVDHFPGPELGEKTVAIQNRRFKVDAGHDPPRGIGEEFELEVAGDRFRVPETEKKERCKIWPISWLQGKM